MKKNLLITCMAFIIMLLGIMFVNNQPAQAAAPIEIYIDDEYVYSDVAPIVSNSRTLVPIRAISETLPGFSVEWGEFDASISIYEYGTLKMVLLIDDKQANLYYDGMNPYIIYLDVAPTIHQGRTMVPVRFIAEAFDCEVEWIESERAVYIYTN